MSIKNQRKFTSSIFVSWVQEPGSAETGKSFASYCFPAMTLHKADLPLPVLPTIKTFCLSVEVTKNKRMKKF